MSRELTPTGYRCCSNSKEVLYRRDRICWLHGRRRCVRFQRHRHAKMVHSRDTDSSRQRHTGRSRTLPGAISRHESSSASWLDHTTCLRQPDMGNLRIPCAAPDTEDDKGPVCPSHLHPGYHPFALHYRIAQLTLLQNLASKNICPVMASLQNWRPRRRTWPNPPHNPKLNHSR